MSIWRPYHNELANMNADTLKKALAEVIFDINNLEHQGRLPWLQNRKTQIENQIKIKNILLTK